MIQFSRAQRQSFIVEVSDLCFSSPSFSDHRASISSEQFPCGTILKQFDDPDVWHEALVSWAPLGVDRASSILTPDDDHYVELTADASAGPLWIGGDARGV